MSGSASASKTTAHRSRKNGLNAGKAASSNPSRSERQGKPAAISHATEIDRSYAKYELQHALTDGIFEPTRKIKDAELRLRKVVRETRLTFKDEKTGKVTSEERVTLTFTVPYALNPQAESILLAIIKLSGMGGIVIEPDQPMLPFFKGAEEDATQRARVQTTCTQYQLLKEAGMTTGKHDYEQLEFYLEQMAGVTVKWENHVTGWRGKSGLMEYATHDDGSLIVQINWRLAGAILGTYEYAAIDLKERYALEKDASKTIHRWLSACLWRGKGDYFKYNTLISHIWTQEASTGAQRKRLYMLKRQILPELAKLPHWQIEMGEEGALITHLKSPK